jgi:hypothetical protein
MIIAEIFAGLGNQMFQYAAARAVSATFNVPLKLNANGFHSDTHRRFELHHFRISAGMATDREIDAFMNPRDTVYDRVTNRLKPAAQRRQVIREEHFRYEDELAAATAHTYLFGHWQSERYFRSQAAAIRRDFAFAQPAEGENQACEEQIRRTPHAVSLHIRRTDYLSHPLMYPCPVAYYEAAIQTVLARVGTPHFFVFSDDPAWSKQHVRIPAPCGATYVTHNRGENSYEDLRLMRACAHHVISNSTFAWWGAWLNADPGKLVVAPRQWFREGALWYNGEVADARDVLPESWIKI